MPGELHDCISATHGCTVYRENLDRDDLQWNIGSAKCGELPLCTLHKFLLRPGTLFTKQQDLETLP
jgi:hypothetical protein